MQLFIRVDQVSIITAISLDPLAAKLKLIQYVLPIFKQPPPCIILCHSDYSNLWLGAHWLAHVIMIDADV